jgi:hypothetical protein
VDRDAVCLRRDRTPAEGSAVVWPSRPRDVTTYRLDDDGDLVDAVSREVRPRVLLGAAAVGEGMYALVNDREVTLHRLDPSAATLAGRVTLARPRSAATSPGPRASAKR